MTKIEFIKTIRAATSFALKESLDLYNKSGGDLEEAYRLAGMHGARFRKPNRPVGASKIFSYTHFHRIGVLVEIASETDFASGTDEFAFLGNECCLQISSMNPTSVADLLSQEYIRNSALKVAELVNTTSAKLGENVEILRFVRYEVGE